MIEVELRLFGAFRNYGSETAEFRLSVPEKTSVASLKKAFAAELRGRVPHFSDEQLVEDSAIADERRILSSGDILERSCRLAILPPVCGG